jgi:hypothetical protein
MARHRSRQNATPESTSQWYERTSAACDGFNWLASGRGIPWKDVELSDALECARRWITDNPCPDPSMGRHLEAMLAAYAELQNAPVAKAVELREVIEQHAMVVDRRQHAQDEEPTTAQFFPEVGSRSTRSVR